MMIITEHSSTEETILVTTAQINEFKECEQRCETQRKYAYLTFSQSFTAEFREHDPCSFDSSIIPGIVFLQYINIRRNS